MWARLQLGAGMFYGSSAVLSVVSALRGRRATWRWNELMGPSTMRGLGVLDTVAAKPVPRRGAQRRERASKRRKFMPKTACNSFVLCSGGSPARDIAYRCCNMLSVWAFEDADTNLYARMYDAADGLKRVS